MNKIIIFDFNRTLYDPEKQALIPGAVETLAQLKSQGFTLHLVSMAADSRHELIKRLGLDQFFRTITLCQKKTLALFQQIVDAEPITKAESFIVGDRVTQEVWFGNELGLVTIWYRNGKFAHELPQTPAEHPVYTTSDLNQIPFLIQTHFNNRP
jgi:FMN phosphatase YigB (HAD superfamily)